MKKPLTLKTIPLEAWIWAVALVFLGVFAPGLEGHFTFCIPSLLGLDACMGCGIGRSIGHLLHGDISASWAAHKLGIAAAVVLVWRIITLIQRSKNNSQTNV